MYLEYLKEKESELQEQIYSKKKELDEVSFRLKENNRFSEVLDKEKTTPFVEFTPQVITATERRIQEDLGEKREIISKKKLIIEKELETLTNEQDKIVSIIKDAKDSIRSERLARKKEIDFIKEKLEEVMIEWDKNYKKAKIMLRNIIDEMQ